MTWFRVGWSCILTTLPLPTSTSSKYPIPTAVRGEVPGNRNSCRKMLVCNFPSAPNYCNGTDISNILTGSHSRQSMALFAAAYGQCCANRSTDRGRDVACAIINNGRMLPSLILGYSQCQKPIDWRVNPDEETTDWRARHGKTAHRVRREGQDIFMIFNATPLSKKLTWVIQNPVRPDI